MKLFTENDFLNFTGVTRGEARRREMAKFCNDRFQQFLLSGQRVFKDPAGTWVPGPIRPYHTARGLLVCVEEIPNE